MARVQTTHALSRLGDSRAPRSIQTSEVGVVEFCGKYEKLAPPAYQNTINMRDAMEVRVSDTAIFSIGIATPRSFPSRYDAICMVFT